MALDAVNHVARALFNCGSRRHRRASLGRVSVTRTLDACHGRGVSLLTLTPSTPFSHSPAARITPPWALERAHESACFRKKRANVRAPVCRKCERVNWSSLSRVIKIFLVSIRSFVVVQFECPFVYDPKLLEKGSRGTGECDDRSSASRHEDAVLVIRQTNFRLSLPSAFPYYLSASECSALAHLH